MVRLVDRLVKLDAVTNSESELATRLLAAASRLVDGIQRGMAERGFDDLRPAHGFAFARIAAAPATVLEVAAHLGVTKQAASQLVDQLVRGGYLDRTPDPADGRRKLLRLTGRGRAATDAAEQSAIAVVRSWRPELGATGTREMTHLLARLDLAGPLRPAW